MGGSVPVEVPSGRQGSQGNTYVYGLDLISATDGAGVQTHHLFDGLDSTTTLTAMRGNVVASYRYDESGAIRTQSGSRANPWLFTGEQPAVGTA